jgi:hypothetical protein
MAVLNQAFVEGAHAVARAIDLHARQTPEASGIAPGPTPIPSPSSTLASTIINSISSATAATLSDAPSATADTPAASSAPASNSGSGTSSPLLFFVALGFGVVFTNLWIIVGVKYCFRYNARNRQLRGLDENGEPINMENMPSRPHRRRREKKLMTMDEVNEKFPMMKYKTWVAGRAQEGLPTAGGVSAPPSRAGSVRSVEGIVPDVAAKEQASLQPTVTDEMTESKKASGAEPERGDQTAPANATEGGAPLDHSRTAGSIMTKDPDRAHVSDDDDDDDDHINAALPPELMTTSGDTCAICIDTLEDDDDVRGLTCGHAFHAVCLDPWLTNRRACCPLCKADYYTPKPRPVQAEGDPNNPTSPHADASRNNGRMNMPRNPQRTLGSWTLRSASRNQSSRRRGAENTDVLGWMRSQTRPTDARRQPARRAPPTSEAPAPEGNQSFLSRLPFRLPPLGRSRGTQPAGSGTNNTTTTPSQLEAGAR